MWGSSCPNVMRMLFSYWDEMFYLSSGSLVAEIRITFAHELCRTRR
jgi:hypothetical protein